MIYAFNTHQERQNLRDNLRVVNSRHRGGWLLMGDFNCVLGYQERLGSTFRAQETHHIRACFEDCDLQNIPYTERSISTGKGHFLPEGISDHCPMTIVVGGNHI
ncbi:hypothetical protein RDABS01_017313 [Bienertia sinuspersici]